MRILQIIPYYLPAVRYGGPIQVVHGLSKAMLAKGVQVTVACTTADGNEELPRGSKEMDGICVKYFQRRRVEKAFGLVPYLGKSVGFFYSPALRNYLKQHLVEYDVVHLHDIFTYPALVAGSIAFSQGVPYVVHTHGMLNEYRMRRRRLKKRLFLGLFGGAMLRRADALIALTEFEREEIVKSGFGVEPRVISNGTDLCMKAEDKTLGGAADKILYLGRIHPIKGIDVLIEAFAEVAKKNGSVELIIAGPDEVGYERHLRGLCNYLGIAGRVQFTGYVDARQRNQLFESASVFALISRSEGFSMAVLEALAHGKPVVISEDCHFDDVAEEKAGFVTGHDKYEIAGRLAMVLHDRELRDSMAGNARQMIEKNYTWDIISTNTLDLYQHILEGCNENSDRKPVFLP